MTLSVSFSEPPLDAADPLEGYVNLLNEQQMVKVQKWLLPAVLGETSHWKKWMADWRKVESGVSKHQLVRRVIEAAPEEERAALEKRAIEIAHELHTEVSPKLLGATRGVSDIMFKRLYTGMIIEQHQLLALAEVCAKARKEKKSVIILPCHKSHIDYIVLQYIFAELNLGPLAIAAGENLNIPIVGRLLRRCGAFFIRRKFGGPEGELYSNIVSAYLEGLLQEGNNIMFFIEGGRSRTGKVLQPKIGLLGMLLEHVLSGEVEDAYIVPASIYYDKVMETRTYVNELLGAKKTQESLGYFVSQAQNLLATKRIYGNISVSFAPYFTARGYIQQQISIQRIGGIRPRFDPRTNKEDKVVLFKALGYYVLDQINKCSSITCTALVGTALLCTMRPGLGRADLLQRVTWLRERVLRSGGHVSALFDFPGELIGPVVDSALKVISNLVTTVPDLLEPVYQVAPGKHFELSYYRNMCVHVFIHQSIIAVVLHRFVQRHPEARSVKLETVMKDVRFISNLLKYEFVFSGVAPNTGSSSKKKSAEEVQEEWGAQLMGSSLMRNFEHALQLLISDKALTMEEGAEVKSIRLTPASQWNKQFVFLCQLVWPVVESYWLVLAGVRYFFGRTPLTKVDEGALQKHLQNFAKTLIHLGHLNYDEAASQETLKKALQIFQEMNILEAEKVTDDSGVTRTMVKLAEAYGAPGGLQKLSTFVDEVGSYRCRSHEQEGGEDYPKYIARLAFRSNL
mmetsp:Transcript_48026/g.102910  ORF Transcript_48026/g.102910 Transcript_48026/m.102910 type:complete len:739 (-) Transcript_48026:116-2332(-)